MPHDMPHDGVAQVVDELRRQVAELHRELVRYQLVVWTAGNVSARVPGHGPARHQAVRRRRTTS